eukprot:TRINITY_DN91143_c0_g1_i1.p1 TRINITY_DN91143_c0_g1~~TRINITY_DN91143_c0_g1_i1.p1  ORF type:complete len:794 (+),score=194.59 TRINITY_DN91143_c0_g1_i1:89-2470(+)
MSVSRSSSALSNPSHAGTAAASTAGGQFYNPAAGKPRLCGERLAQLSQRPWSQSVKRSPRTSELFRLPDERADTWTVGGARAPAFGATAAAGRVTYSVSDAYRRSRKTSRPPGLPVHLVKQNILQGSIKAVYLGSNAGAEDDALSHIGSLLNGNAASAVEVDAEALLKRELAKVRTGEDAVQFFSRRMAGVLTEIQIIYLQRPEDSSSPYSLVVVPQEKVQGEHFSISAKGVVHVMPGQLCECIPLAEWQSQAMHYRVLSSMSTFRLCAKRKLFADWWSGAKYSNYCQRRSRLAQTCFFAKPAFASALSGAMSIVHSTATAKLIQLSDTGAMELEELSELQGTVRNHFRDGCHKMLHEKHDSLVERMEVLRDTVHKQVADIEKEAAAAKSKATSQQAARSKPMLQEKQEARQRARRYRLVREDKAKLGACIRLVDYMRQAAGVVAAFQTLRMLKSRVLPTAGKHEGLVTVHVRLSACDNELQLEPQRDCLTSTLLQYVSDAVDLLDSVPRVSSAPSLRKHAADYGAEGLRTRLACSNSYGRELAELREGILAAWQEAKAYAEKDCGPCLRISRFGEEHKQVTLAARQLSTKAMMNEMDLMSEFEDDLGRLHSQRRLGFLLMDLRRFRSELAVVPQVALDGFRQGLLLLWRSGCVQLCRRLDKAIFELDWRPSAESELAAFDKKVKAIRAERPSIIDSAHEVRSMHSHLGKYNVKLSVEDQLQLDTLQAKELDFSKRSLPAAVSFIDAADVKVLLTGGCETSKEQECSTTPGSRYTRQGSIPMSGHDPFVDYGS